jgi:methyl-accepting chemotaxis protein
MNNSLLVRLLPRSLRAQTMFMLIASLGVSAVGLGPIAWTHVKAQFAEELEKRGRTTVETLEKHSDLRLALSLGDDKQAQPILAAVAQSDGDIRYVAILGAKKQVIAWAPDRFDREEMNRQQALHFGQGNDDDIKRFRREVVRAKEVPTDFPDPLKSAKSNETETLGWVILGLSAKRTNERALVQALTYVGVGTLGIFMVLILLYFNWVAKRLLRMAEFAQAIAAGELTHQLDDPVDDDLGRLAEALRSMKDRTSRVVAQLQTASSSLSLASAELFDSSSRQALNASKQAASVSEMGATVAELRETFGHATTKAESVIELARRSEESSTGGAEAVKGSIDGMGHIRDQVGAISVTISGLVQRTDQIDAIIDVVNDLAEQSNVLALNAGIEAARAGEHGRGFAVVAREVRSLAERSKEATSQVRSILQDIKLAGREAVRAIEEGSRRAEMGMGVANAAGEAIKRLGDAIAASSAAAMQIASSTRQQSVGVEQIWQATKEIDRIATETANGIQQLEAAAANMKELSAAMAEIVGRYKLGATSLG